MSRAEINEQLIKILRDMGATEIEFHPDGSLKGVSFAPFRTVTIATPPIPGDVIHPWPMAPIVPHTPRDPLGPVIAMYMAQTPDMDGMPHIDFTTYTENK